MFSLRIVSTSHYQAEPLPDLDVQYSSCRSTDVRKVPVLRIFGATPAGQKTCMHVHGVFPYLYVPYDGTAPTDSYLRRFAASLDKAINVANNSQANTQHVFKISLVAGIPMYGYHPEEQQFLKIYLYNPSTVRKAADLLLGGAVMNKSFQPHEAHIPFPLQLFIDYNLYGMNMINVAAVKFRRKSPTPSDGKPSRKSRHKGADSGDTSMGGMGFSPSPPFSVNTPGSSSSSSTPCMTVWDMDHIPSDLLLPANVERQSVCELEVDVVAADILNRREVTDNMGKNPGLAALWEDERQRRRDVGQPSQITPQQSQDHDQVEMSSSEQELLERFTEIVHQHQALRRSESEESEMSVEESTLSPEDITCIPASQLEDHSQPASQYADSQESQQSSQGTVVVEGEGEEEGAVISVASIQRVVSFSQSFSRPGSQPTSTPPEGEAADQSLVEVLAALAEESSPVASQRCAAQVEALEDEDSMVGRRVALPPDSAALQQDMEETLHMSQTLPDNSYDVEGLETTWDGSPDQQKYGDMDSDETGSEEGDDDDIPQLDGASDPKPGSKKSGKKRLGVRGPVLSTLAAAIRQEGSAQGEASELLPYRDPTPPLPQPSPSLTSQANDSQHCFKEGPHDSAFGSSSVEVPVSSSFSFCKSSLSCVSGGDVDVVTTMAPSLPYGNSSKDEDGGQHCRGDGGLLGRTEPCPQKPVSSMALVTSTWCGDQCGDQTSSPAGEEAVSMGTMEVCGNEAQSCRRPDSGIDMSASSSSCQCVVRMERLDRWIHPKKLALSLNRAQQPSPDRPVISPPSLPSPPSTPYSFTYHVPIPVYKRLKAHGACSEREPEEIQCVRLHFMDAQPNLLQKLGQELVRVQPLTADDLKHAGVVLDKRVDEGEVVSENVFQECDAEGQFSVVPFPRDDTSLSVQDRGKRGKRRPLMGPKCCRKSTGTSGRCQTSFTGPDMGERGSEQEVDKDSGGGVHIAMGVSAGNSAALLQTCSTARTCFAMEDYGKDMDCQPLVVTSTRLVCSPKADDGEQGKVSSHSPPHAGRSTVEGGHNSHLAELGVRTSQPLPVTAQSSYHMSLSPSSVPSAPVSLPFSASASLPISLVSSRNKSGMIPPLSSQSCSLSPGRFGSSHSDTLHQAGPSAPCTTYSSFPSIPVTVSSSSPDLGSYRSNHMAGGVDGQSSASRQPGPTSPLPHHHNSMYSLQGQCSQGSKHTSSGSPPKHTSPQPADELSCLQHCASCYSSQTSLGSPQLVTADTAGFEKWKNAETCLKSSNHGFSSLPSHCDSHTQSDKQSENKMAVEHSENEEELKSERKCLQFPQNVNSDDHFSGKGHKACEDKTVRRKSNSSAINDVASDIDLLDELPLSALRHSSVQLWSIGDSDSDSDSMDSDESSDDYCPNSRAQRKKGKRKGNKQLNKSGSKRAKWSVVNNGVHSNSKHAAHDGEKKQSRKGQKNRGGKTKRKMKKEQLIEGVHYIVIGKFKGHRVMLVKLERVKVSPNDRVKVSDWQGRNTGNGVKTKPRLLGPRCCRLANGISASHPSLLHLPTKTPPSPDGGHHASAALEENPATAWETPNVSAPSLNREDSTIEEVAAVQESDSVNHKGSQPMTGMPKAGDLQQGHGSLTAEHLLMHNGTVIPEKLLFSSAVMIEKLQQNKIVKTEEMPKQNILVDMDESQQQDGILNIEKSQQQNSVRSEEVRQQNSVNGEALQQQNSVKVEKIQQCNSVGGEELQQEGTLDTDRTEMLEAHDESGSALSADTVKNASLQLRAMVARQRKRKKGLNRVPSAPSNLQTSTGKEADNTEQGRPVYCAENLQLQDTPVGRGQHVEEQKGKGKDQDKSLPASSVPCSFVGSEEGESSQESSTAQHPAPPPAAVDLDTDSRLAASECTSHTQSPVPRMGQLSSHPPFTISEHSQDADCSSVPQSNPESTSSSPAFPRMALTHADSKDDDEPSAVLAESAAQTPSTAKKEVREGDHRSPAPLCLQSVCKKMKEVRASQRTMEASSDSSDSQDGVDEELAYIKHQQKSTQVLGLPWKDRLMLDEGVITADMDKDKLKKQKKLTPNQRLGVAFLSKRRRKGKLKGGSGKSEGGGGSSKVMDSLSLLHMATLASLGAKTDSSGDTYRCTTWRLVSSKVEEKENHNVATLQHSGGNLQWKTFSFCAGAEKREGKSDSGVDEESLLTLEKGPDLGDVQAIEEDMSMGEETSTIQNMEPGHPQDSKSMEAGREDKGSDDSGDETDDYDISESLESVKGEKRGETAAKSKNMSSESSDERVGMKSESRSDGQIQNDTTNNKSCDYKPPLYEDSDDKTDDYTVVGNLKRSSNRRPRDNRNRRVKRKARGSRNKSSKSSSKVLDSLDVLHMATLASLGTDPAPPVHDDTLPRYSDSVWDHTDDYEESLIKMAYTSPVPSDVADLSPPLPLSPEDLSKVNLKNIQKQRPMPCRSKVEESRGTRNVCMAQVRAENAAERMSRLFVPLSRHDPQGSWQANGAAKDSVLVGSSPRMKQHTVPVLSRSASESAAHPGPVKPLCLQSVFVDRTASSQSLPSTCHSAQTSIPNRDKLFMTGQNAQQAIHNRGKLSVTSHSAQTSIPSPDKLSMTCHSAQTTVPNPDKLSMTCHSAQTSIPNPDKLSMTCHSAQTSIPRTDKLPTIPNPDKLPVPSIPWHHPLHVAIDCAEGRALKEEVIHNITSKKLNSRCTSLDNSSSPNLSLQFKDGFSLEDRQASVSSGTSTQSAAFLRSLPLPTRLVRDNRRIQPSSSAPLSRSGERTPRVLQSDMPVPRRVSVSGGPLGEIHNHVGSRPLPFSSLAQRYAQRDRDSERIPSVSDRVSELNEQHWGKSCGIWQTSTNSRSNAHPCRTDSNADSFCTSPASSKLSLTGSSYQWPSQSPKESEGGLYCSTNKPATPFSPRGLHSMGSKTSPYGGRSFWSRSLDNREISSQGEEGSKSQREGESRCQREGELRNQREGEFRIYREGELRNQGEGKVGNQREGELRSQREGELFRNQREGENRNERDGEIQSQQDRESRNQRDGEVRIQRDGEVRSLRDDCVFADGMTPGVGVHSQPPGTPTIRSDGPHAGNPSPVSHPHLPSSHHSPRLSRTEMVISQIFNLDSTSKTCKPWQNYAHHTSPHSIQKDRWPDSKLDMERNSGKPLCDQQGESHMLRQHSTDLISPASVSWEQLPIGRSESLECPFPSSQPSTLQRSDDDETRPTKKWSNMASKYDGIRSSFSEMSVSQVMFRDREKSNQSPSAVFCDSSPLTGNPQSTGWYKPASSPGQSHQIRSHQMRSPPTYQDIAYSSLKSPRSCSSSTLVTSKWPGYSCENQPSFMSKSSSFHSSDRSREDSKLPVSSGIEKNHYSSTSCSTNMDRNMNGVKLAESCNKDLSGSTSPMVCSPSKAHSSMTATSKSPCRGSPRSKQWESIRPSKADEWHQQKRKRSVGEYLEEMIESAYAKGPTEERPYGWSEVPREDFGHPVKCSAESSYMQAMAANGLTSSALDLSVCSGKIDSADQSVSSGLSAPTPSISSVPVTCTSSPPVHMPSSYAMTGVSSVLSTTYHTSVPMVTAFTTAVTCTSTVPPVCCAALNTSRPTWTTIKTDDFENITDDEDEEVIPSSQGYSTSVYRFPGFRRLSSISSTWTPYSVHNQQSLSAAPVTGSQTGTDADIRASLSETVMSSHRYISSLYTKGLYSQCSRVSESSQLNYGTKLGQTGSNKEQYRGEDRDVMMQCTQKEEQGIVSSLGTPWRETQPSVSVPTSSHMSQFEPITDSEEEEEKSNMDNIHSSHTGTSHYMSSVSSAAFSGSTFFPVHSLMTSSAYSALGSSVMAPTSSIVQPLLQDKPVTASPILSQKSPGYTAASNRLFSLTGNFSAEEPSSSIQGSDSLSDVHAVSSMLSEKRVLLCSEGGAEKGDDSEPEDGGGRKRKKGGDASPTGRPPSSSQRSHREKGEKEGRPENMGSGWRRSPEEGSLDPWSREKPRQVLCPRAPPPSRQTVEASAASVGLSVEPVRPAFCSHPPDLPETPRELGGRVLCLPTNTVRELEELLPSGEGRGLGAWQSLKASENPILSSQPHPSSLAQRLQAEPQLRFVLAGDGPCVITPVRPPPRCSQVTTWLQDMMQTMVPPRSQADLKGETTEEGEEAWGTSRETSMPLDIDLPGEDSEEQGSQDSSDEETSIFTRLKSRPGQAGQKTQRDDAGDDISHGSSTPKRQRLDSDVLHSTPVRRSSSDLFDVTCTPISHSQRGESSGQQGDTSDPQFVPPARPPLRRLSTNTQAALTKAMMTSDRRRQSLEGETSQIDAPTPRNAHGFKVTQQNLQDAKALHKHQFLTVLSMELHTDSRGDLMPDPEVDAIRVVFYAVFDDIPPEKGPRNMTGAIVVDRESCQAGGGDGCRPSTSAGTGRHGKQTLFEKCSVVEDLEVVYVPSETDLIHHLASFIVRLDPDILLGFEVQQMSWGFLLQRAAHLSINLCSKIARIHGPKQGSRFSAEKDEWGADHTSEIHIEGRIVLNLWRLLRHEVTLNIYSFENCAFHILHRRVPAFTYRTLTFWYDHRTHLHAWRVVDHYMQRVKGQLAMLDQLDLIGKTSEFARVFGIEFFDVLSRGSQYRVESMMLRLAKPLNFIPVSPSVQQRARQKAPECIPLTLEPQSQMYTDPVVVLDFQSLYPSIMIAYNYCFSTCLGRLEHLAQANEGPIEFGCTSLNIAPETLKKVRKHVTISPNGCVFVTGKVRKGVLPMMVEEILKTRLMVKKSMKDYKDDKTLHRLLDARQLGLKLIANVTYGYTGASFSGRMPCIEVGDSIVRKARESLERAIQLVEDTAHWHAQVVYGDTDSLFIRLPGRSKDEAFVLGQEIADTVTNMFPKPMKLKFEKVYLPCVLQTKKRYVGFMYESADQQEAVFDAKGIETVRRDNCGVVSKVLERCIKIMFTQRDVSLVRAYLHRQLTKMLAGRVGLQDYVFAKEYRGMMGYKPGACVPALEIARKRLRVDRRGEPRVGERVPYVIVHGSPGLPLIQLVRQPRELLRDPSLRINVTYYITKQVLPPLDRLLSLVGVSVFQWYSDMPKVVRLAPHVAPDTQRTRQGTISQYFVTSDCLVCEGQTKEAVCASCRQDPQLVALTLASRSANYERQQNRLAKVCHTCMGVQDSTQPCVSLDCPVLFRRHLATIDLARADLHREALLKLTTF